MDAAQVLKTLMREQQLLREFCRLSECHDSVITDDDRFVVRDLLEVRSDLMLELTAVDATLATWIDQVREMQWIPTDILGELRVINDDIVSLATSVVKLDEETQSRLEFADRPVQQGEPF